MHNRPDLMQVKVKNCKDVNGVRWCSITIEPVLINDENLKNYIIQVEAEPVWVKTK